MTIGPLKPNAGSEAAKTILRESNVEKQSDHDSADQVRQSDRVELSLDQKGARVPRVTYSLDEVLSSDGHEIPAANTDSRLLSSERLEQIRFRITDGFYNSPEVNDEIAGKIISRSQENE